MSGSNRVADGKVVTLHYSLRIDDGPAVVDTRADEEPMSYLHGAQNIVPGLEQALEGRSVGESLTTEIAPENGYGERDPDAVQQIPKDAFPPELTLEPGMQLTAEDEDGNLTPLFVQEIAEEHVVVDMNHPLAGRTLHYDVTIVEIRDATAQERSHGHAHGEGGHHH